MMEQRLLGMAPHERLLALMAENRIIRKAWRGKTPNGRETACLYAALVPGARSTNDCPANLLPQWLADMVPGIDDSGSDSAWPGMVRRFAAVLPWRLDATADRRVLAATMIAALDIAAPHDSAGVVAPIRDLWARVLAGDEPAQDEWGAAEAAVWAADAAVWAAALDKITDALLSAIERELVDKVKPATE